MKGLLLTLLLFSASAAAQKGFVGLPKFPPDLIDNDSPIRDVAKLDMKHVKVDADNARLRVLRISLGAGEALPTHDSRDGVLVCLTACSLTITNPVGYVREVKLDAGQTLWMQGARHKVATTGGAVELLYIEAKRPPN
jgi:hypothetical protein